MPSTYSSSLRLELQATGENRNTWGTKNNTVINLIEAALAGFESIDMSDDNVTLTTSNGSSDQARKAILNFTGTNTAARNVTIPTVSKQYIIRNATTGGFSISVTNGSSSVTVANGTTALVFTDGTTVWNALSVASITSGSITGITDLAVADGGTGASTASGARTNLGLGSIATADVTVSTNDPSGGDDGDIWMKVAV